ncbi:MAG: SirB2 family protein [Gallionellaceae bacterium]|nr:SirB2 family protein [Gallionellaceae bacterium]
MSFLWIKYLHISCVILSYGLFLLRGIWILKASPIMQQRWVRIAPHIIDTALLGSAITLAMMLNISPLETPWLLAKIIALLLYITLGTIAIKRGKSKRIRLGAWLGAQIVFLYIVLTALSHDPLPWHALDE